VNNTASNQDVLFTIPNPVITSISPSSGPIGTQVTVRGTGFGATQGSSTFKLLGVAGNIISWADNQIVATIAPGSMTGYITVTVSGVSSHVGDVDYTIPPPQITSVSPSSGAPGTSVTLTGSGFRATQSAGGNTSGVYFNGTGAAVTSWSDTQIVATVPANVLTGPVTVSGFNANSNANIVFILPNPVITSITPSSGPVSSSVQINGSGFGATQGTVKFNPSVSATITAWSDTQITATVPTTATTGGVSVTAGGVTSNSNINFTVPKPQITSISPTSGVVGTQVTVTGSGFQATKGSNSAGFPVGSFTIVSWSDTQIVGTAPIAFGTNPVVVTVNSITSNNDLEFTMPSPILQSIAPLGGAVGTHVQISGSGFGATQGSSTVTLNFTNAAIVSWSDTLITATVPSTTTGGIRVMVGGVTASSVLTFTVSNLFVNAISPQAGPVGTQVTIAGNGFGASQGTSTVSFNSTAATAISSWSDSQIVATVPTGATTGGVKVTVGSTSSNTGNTYTVGGVSVTGVNPTSGLPGAQIQISGSGFGTTQGTSSVTVNGWTATPTVWSDGSITTTVPATATVSAGPIKVTVGGVASNTTTNFTILGPVITSLSPSSGTPGTQVQVNGSGFGATQGSSSFSFNGTAGSVVTWSDTAITVAVPPAATAGRVWVAEGSQNSNTNLNFTVPAPKITSISPTSGIIGTQVTINGSGFRASQGSSSVLINGFTVPVVSWSDTQIVVTVSASIKTGPVTISGASIVSNSDFVFTLPNPTVVSLTPISGPPGTQIQINGSGFGATQGTSTLTVHGIAATVTSWSDTAISATVPTTASSGPAAVTVGGVPSNANINFTIPAPQVTSISPNSGIIGTQITVTGANFQPTKGNNFLGLSNALGGFGAATIVSWSDTQIVATVPANNTISGPAEVSVNTVTSNQDIGFTMINPRVTGILPTSGPVGTQVQINGSGFGATQGSSTVQVAGYVASVSSWSDSQIVVTVPATSKSGSVVVYASGVSSNNNINFTVPVPHVTGISPSSGQVGTTVTITGSGFEAVGGSVSFNGASTGTVQSWSDTQIVLAVPAAALSGEVTVIPQNGSVSNSDFVFTLPNPRVTSLAPATGRGGTQVQINGTGFGATQGSSTVSFNALGNINASVVSWSDTQIMAIAPTAAISGAVYVSEGGITSNRTVFFNVPAPTITGISPAIGGAGNQVTITGTGFQTLQGGNSYVTFSSGGSATIKSWTDTQIVAVVPTATTTGFLDVAVNSILSNYVNYTIPSQTISSLTPNTGPVGTSVTVAGTAFGSSQGTSVLSFNGQPATVSSWTNTQIVATVPVTSATGPAIVTLGGVNSNTALFTVPPPNVSNFQPTGGIPNTTVTIHGSGFQANQRNSTVTFNGAPATVTSWSDTQIVTSVPAGATTGPLLVNVNFVPSQNNFLTQFEVPYPVITSINPPEAPAGGTITITGSGFGANESYSPDGVSTVYTGFIFFNGVQSLALSWSDTSITTYVPSQATSGNVTITKYDATSNAVPLSVEGAPTVASLSPDNGAVGDTITLNGSGFGSAQRTSTVYFNGAPAFVSSWSDTAVTAVVPGGASTGPVSVNVVGITGPTSRFKLTNSVQVTDSLGNITSYHFEQLGGQWNYSRQSGTGCSSCEVQGTLNLTKGSATHNDSADVTTTTDELTHTTTYTWDSDHNLLSESTPLDANNTVTTAYTYNSFGEPLTVTDPLGNVTTNAYDANGNLLSVISPAPNGTTAASVTQFAYDTKGQLTTITDPLSHVTTLAYNATGLISSITDAQSNVTSYEYDQRGNRTAVVDALQNRTTFAYDLANRLTGITYPDSTSVSFGYDSRGRRTSVTDQNGHITTYAYDDADRLLSVTDAAQHVTQYTYDTENNLLSITDASGYATSFIYDSERRVVQTAFPSGLVESYVYDVLGNLTSKTDRKNQTILYVYDALNRLTHKGYPDATGVDYVYDLAGKIKQVTDPTGTYGIAYDNMGRLIGTTTQYAFLPDNTYTNSYNYDAASNRTSFSAPDGSTNTYAYDTLGRLSVLTNSLAGQFGFGYDNLSRRTALTRPNGVNTSYNYDSASRLLSVLHQNGTTTMDGAGYTYDNAGNRTVKSNYLNNITENYTYDPLYQLTQVTQGATTTESYSYDAVGNRLSSLGMSPYAYNSSNELTSTPAATFTYDGNGNTLTKGDSSGTTTYSWDFENHLTSVILPGSGGAVTFKYDPFGRRIQKNSSSATVNYLYDGSNSVVEMDSTGTLFARYAQGAGIDEPLVQLSGGAAIFYEQDGLGSVTSTTNSAASLSNTYIYDAFGKATTSTGTAPNQFLYTARNADSETGLLFYRARYYSADTGRFLSEDPLRFESGPSFYVYVGNHSLNFSDPTGLQRQPIGTGTQSGPASNQYNCAAWGLGLNWVWVTTPDYKSPNKIFPHFGCTQISCDSPVNCKVRAKVKVFEDSANGLNWHVERQTCDNGWTSKYGQGPLYYNISNPDADYVAVYHPKGKVKSTCWNCPIRPPFAVPQSPDIKYEHPPQGPAH
jgi:RHS repeat-associated protein